MNEFDTGSQVEQKPETSDKLTEMLRRIDNETERETLRVNLILLYLIHSQLIDSVPDKKKKIPVSLTLEYINGIARTSVSAEDVKMILTKPGINPQNINTKHDKGNGKEYVEVVCALGQVNWRLNTILNQLNESLNPEQRVSLDQLLSMITEHTLDPIWAIGGQDIDDQEPTDGSWVAEPDVNHDIWGDD